MSVVQSQCEAAKYPSMELAVGVCAFGRAVDFATTWVALRGGLAAETKVGTAQLFEWLGPHRGLIAYETLITTPIIFLGCYLLGRSRTFRPKDNPTDYSPKLAQRMFFVSVGVISLIIATHNTRYLF